MRKKCGLIIDAWPDFANTFEVELILLLLIYGIVKCRVPKLHAVRARTRPKQNVEATANYVQ
jgi:hypothetical protein